jgi:hypothetical protein
VSKRPRKTVGRRLKRNPVARALGSGLFRQKVVERPDKPRRRPKYPKRLIEEEE